MGTLVYLETIRSETNTIFIIKLHVKNVSSNKSPATYIIYVITVHSVHKKYLNYINFFNNYIISK